MDPEYRGLKHQRRINKFSLLKPVWMFFAFELYKPRAGVYSASSFRRRGRRREIKYRYYTTSRCLRGLRETNEEVAATKDDSLDYQSKQAIYKPRAGVYSASSFRRRSRRRERNYLYYTTSRCLRGLRETNEEVAATKNDSLDYQSKQAI